MVILLDLNNHVESLDTALWEDAPLDTVMVLATRRGALSDRSAPAPPNTATDDPPDDDAYITWEDAEWQ